MALCRVNKQLEISTLQRLGPARAAGNEAPFADLACRLTRLCVLQTMLLCAVGLACALTTQEI